MTKKDRMQYVALPPPREYWKCFYCGAVFVTEDSARQHFGDRDPRNPLHAREMARTQTTTKKS